MSLPVSALVEAAPNFIGNLVEARLFLIEQDAESATERFRKLKAELRKMFTVLGRSPGRGRADFSEIWPAAQQMHSARQRE